MEYISFDEITDRKLAEFSEQDKEVHSTGSLTSSAVSIAWGVTENLTLAARLPYVYRRDIREAEHDHGAEAAEEIGHHDEEGHDEEGVHAEEELHNEGGVADLGNSSGIGDASLYGQYRFLNNPDYGVLAAMIFGIKVPTGKTDERTRHGEKFEAEHQPGSGSWDPLAGLAASLLLGRLNIVASALYSLVTEGTQDTDLGDAFYYNVAVSHRLGSGGSDHGHHDHAAHGHGEWDLVMELNGEWRDKVDINGENDANTGGNLIYVSPGVRYTAPGGWAAAISAGIPVIENLNGIQSEPGWRVLANIGLVF